MKTKKKKTKKYVYLNGIRYIKKSNLLVLDQVIKSFDSFHNYTRLQTI